MRELIIYSKLIYGIVFWGGTWQKNLNPVILVQKRIIRCMSFARKYDSTAGLFNQFNLLRFEYIYSYFCKLLGHKVIHCNYLRNIFSIVNHGQNTRGAGRNIELPNSRFTVVHKGFIHQIAQSWNSQQSSEKNILNLESYKRKIKYLLHLEQSS